MPSYTVIGTPFSTFTRTITLALRYKGIPFEQVRVTPHSDVACANHPFGYLPTLVIHEEGKGDVKLCETPAIARYLERVKPEPSLELGAATSAAVLPEKMWELASIVASLGFPAVEIGVVKPRVKAADEGTPSAVELKQQIQDNVTKLTEFLSKIEALMLRDGFAFGSHLTWADLYLFPLLSDLRAVPEGEILSKRMKAWMSEMDMVQAVKDTSEGTLSVGARP